MNYLIKNVCQEDSLLIVDDVFDDQRGDQSFARKGPAEYPHSLEGLSTEEIAANRPALYEIMKNHLDRGKA